MQRQPYDFDSTLTSQRGARGRCRQVSLSSQTAAIDYYLAELQRERDGTAVASLSMACSLTN